MKTTRKIIEIDEEMCDGCGQCVVACAEGAIRIEDGKARIISENLCDGLGACIGDCPTGALTIVEREAEAFDEEAVEEHLKNMEQHKSEPSSAESPACACPSMQMKTFAADPAPADKPAAGGASALTHWPIKIRLVPPKAPFLKGADLLVLADCVAVAYTGLHRELLNGKVVMMGCPKFDNAEGYIRKFVEVFAEADINSVTVATIEVPCCSGLPWIVKKGLEKSGRSVPFHEIVISAKGEILSETKQTTSEAEFDAASGAIRKSG